MCNFISVKESIIEILLIDRRRITNPYLQVCYFSIVNGHNIKVFNDEHLLLKDSLLWWVCVVLVATLQLTVKGQEFLSEDEVEVEEVMAEDENEVLNAPSVLCKYIYILLFIFFFLSLMQTNGFI